jgi:hypothetical protein
MIWAFSQNLGVFVTNREQSDKARHVGGVTGTRKAESPDTMQTVPVTWRFDDDQDAGVVPMTCSDRKEWKDSFAG